MPLLEYQKPHAEQLIQALDLYGSSAIDASDTGTGKTYAAVYIAQVLGLKPIVLCPKAVSISWKRVLDMFGVEYLGISNYEMFKGMKWYAYDENTTDTDELGKATRCDYITKKGKGAEMRYEWVGLEDNVLIIFDEAHRCKNHKSINSKLMLSTKDLTARKLLLSATIADKPKFFATFSVMLDFCESVEHYRMFKRKLEIGKAKTVNQYLKNGENVAMLKLHEMIFPDHGSRMRIKDLGDAFQKNQISAETYVMDEETVKGIRDAYSSICAISVQAEAREQEASCPLAIMIRARQKVEALKVKTMADLAVDHLENGNSVVVFINYLDTMDLMMEALSDRGFPVKLVIKGGQSMKERQGIVDMFQEDKEHIIICQIQSGGVGIGLHDTIGDRPRVSIISPSWSAQDLMQTFGRIHRSGGKTVCLQKMVYCHGTVEDRICKIVNQKLLNYLQLNDGGGNSDNTPKPTPKSRPVINKKDKPSKVKVKVKVNPVKPVKPNPPKPKSVSNSNVSTGDTSTADPCVVCMNGPRNMLVLHSNGKEGHLCICRECAIELRKQKAPCPICRESVKEYVRAY